MRKPNYDKYPTVSATEFTDECWCGWTDITNYINALISERRNDAPFVVTIECYTGLHEDEIASHFRAGITQDRFVLTDDAFKSPSDIDELIAPYLGGDDPIFGFMSPLSLDTFLDPIKRLSMQLETATAHGVTVVFGTGALLCCEPDLVIYADMPRWEGQLRQRRGEVTNLGACNKGLKGSLQYKRSYFIDWRACDRLKRDSLDRWDLLLDTTDRHSPKMISGRAMRTALKGASRQPFRVVPFFDPAPWGGQWLKEVCDLDRSVSNFGWGFDCVPEENSLLLKFGETIVEVPSVNLLFQEPQDLLGDGVYGLFGPEFPIRFDFLDTIGGGNLSLQVHPLVAYAQEQFGMHYTQDESYYILDAGPDATVLLGVKPNVDKDELFDALETAGTTGFDAENYVNTWPAKKHDHFLIPSGTIHCSGQDTVVLEISATPYIFTFKLWDWGRLGLDGLPRPINLKHGRKVLQMNRDTAWVRDNLINSIQQVASDSEWREERTGLHSLEFIETRRHWFKGKVPHNTCGTVNVLNLVQGDEVIVESPMEAFAPYVIHYAETFIIPAAVGAYTIRPYGSSIGSECSTVKAFVRVGNRENIHQNW